MNEDDAEKKEFIVLPMFNEVITRKANTNELMAIGIAHLFSVINGARCDLVFNVSIYDLFVSLNRLVPIYIYHSRWWENDKKEMGTRTKYDLCVYICERINKELRDGYSKGNRNKDEKKENKQEEVRINKEMRKDGRTLRSCSWFSYDV